MTLHDPIAHYIPHPIPYIIIHQLVFSPEVKADTTTTERRAAQLRFLGLHHRWAPPQSQVSEQHLTTIFHGEHHDAADYFRARAPARAPAPMASAPLAFLHRAALVQALLLCVLCHLPAPCASQAARARGQGVARRTSGSRVGGGARGGLSGRARGGGGGGGGGGASRSRRSGGGGGAGWGRYSRPSSLKRLPTPTTTAVGRPVVPVGRALHFRDAWRAAGRAARPPAAGKAAAAAAAAAAMQVKKRPPAVAAKVPGGALHSSPFQLNCQPLCP